MQRFLSSTLLSLALLGLGTVAQAQPAPPQVEKTPTIAELKAKGRANYFAYFNSQLKRLGLNEEEISAVTNFMASQETERTLLRKAAYQLQLAEKLTDAEYEVYWNDYQTLAEGFHTKRAAELEKLKPQIKWKERPKLQTFLSFQGAFSDDLSVMASFSDLYSSSLRLNYDLEREFQLPQRVVKDKQ
ncbi:hypothetical protein EON80_22295 [bacterium]|nr:MAG: hypothetical protein EON80_22295 [bacterium]